MTGIRTPAGYYRRDGRFVPPTGTRRPSRRKQQGIVLLSSNRRKNRIGISDELPQWRSIGWNVMFVAVEAALTCWAHFVVGVSWTAIGLGVGGVCVLGVGLVAYVVLVGTPREARRHHALLRAHAAASTTSPSSGREHREVVDSQSTPHRAAPSLSSNSPIRASRAR